MQSIFRPVRLGDFDSVFHILRAAAHTMVEKGRHQWDENYPCATDLRVDFEKAIGYVIEEEGSIVAYAAVSFSGEPAYDALQGCWLSHSDYVVVHRMAVLRDALGRGMRAVFFRRWKNFVKSAEWVVSASILITTMLRCFRSCAILALFIAERYIISEALLKKRNAWLLRNYYKYLNVNLSEKDPRRGTFGLFFFQRKTRFLFSRCHRGEKILMDRHLSV